MERVFVDTSAWFAYANARDADHAGVRASLEKWKSRLVTSNFVFDETVTLLLMRGGAANAARMGESLRDPGVVRLIRISPEDEDEAWLLFTRRADQGYSFTDCTSFVLMRRLGLATAISLDEHFRQAGFLVQPG